MAQLVIPIDILPTQLSTNIASGTTTFSVASTAGFAASGLLSLDNKETVEYSGIAGNTFTGITRGTNGTTARAFPIGTKIYQAKWLATEAEVAGRNTTIQYQEDGVGIGSKGGIDYVNFTGDITAEELVAGTLIVNVTGGGGGGLTQPQVMARTLGC